MMMNRSVTKKVTETTRIQRPARVRCPVSIRKRPKQARPTETSSRQLMARMKKRTNSAVRRSSNMSIIQRMKAAAIGWKWKSKKSAP